MTNFPEKEAFSHIELLARQVVEGYIMGLHKSPFHGFSVEFAEHRLYNSGESTRHIDWKLYGKTDRLFVKRYEEETNLRCYLLMDKSSSMRFEGKLTFSCYAAACLVHLMARQRDAIGLSLFSDRLEAQTELKSTVAHQKHLFEMLSSAMEPSNSPADSDPDFRLSGLLDRLAEQIHKRSLVIIFSDLLCPKEDREHLFSALQHLRFKQNEVIVFHTLASAKEVHFSYGNQPHRFIDLESGQSLKLHPLEVQQAYTAEIQNFRTQLQERCQQYHIDYIDADADQGYFPILNAYLRKRNR